MIVNRINKKLKNKLNVFEVFQSHHNIYMIIRLTLVTPYLLIKEQVRIRLMKFMLYPYGMFSKDPQGTFFKI